MKALSLFLAVVFLVVFLAGIGLAQPPIKFSNEPRTNTINPTDLWLLDSDIGGGNFSTRTIVQSNVLANILSSVPPAHNAIANSNGIGTNTILYRNTNIAINVQASLLSDSFGVPSIDFDGRQMADSQSRLSLDFNGRQLWKNATNQTLDYGNSVLQGNWSVGGGLLTADGSALFNIKGSAVNMTGGTNILVTYAGNGQAIINVANNGLLGGQIPGVSNYLDSQFRVVFTNLNTGASAYFDTNMFGSGSAARIRVFTNGAVMGPYGIITNANAGSLTAGIQEALNVTPVYGTNQPGGIYIELGPGTFYLSTNLYTRGTTNVNSIHLIGQGIQATAIVGLTNTEVWLIDATNSGQQMTFDMRDLTMATTTFTTTNMLRFNCTNSGISRGSIKDCAFVQWVRATNNGSGGVLPSRGLWTLSTVGPAGNSNNNVTPIFLNSGASDVFSVEHCSFCFMGTAVFATPNSPVIRDCMFQFCGATDNQPTNDWPVTDPRYTGAAIYYGEQIPYQNANLAGKWADIENDSFVTCNTPFMFKDGLSGNITLRNLHFENASTTSFIIDDLFSNGGTTRGTITLFDPRGAAAGFIPPLACYMITNSANYSSWSSNSTPTNLYIINTQTNGLMLAGSSPSSQAWLYGQNGTTKGAFDNDSFLAVRMGLEGGNVYSNYNRYMWTNWQAATLANKSKVLMLCQDGLSSVGFASNFWHNAAFTNTFYISGVVLGSDFPLWYGNVNVVNGGLFVPAQDPLWVQGWYLLGNLNSNVVFQGSTVNPQADFGVVYWVEESTAGHIKIETNLNGGAYTTVLGLGNIDASGGAYSLGAGTMIARWATWTNPSPAAMTIRVTEQDSGKAVKVLGGGWVNRSITNGVIEANWAGNQSCGWSNMLTTNVNVLGNYLKYVNPKIILDEHLTWDSTGVLGDPGGSETYFQQFRDMIRTNLPYADHVFTGVYPADSTTQQQTNEYRMLTNAIYWGLGYFDGVSPLVDLATMTNRGYSSVTNIAHANALGMGAYDALLQYWLDLNSTPKPGVYPYWLTAQQPEFLYQIDYQPGPVNQGDKMSYFLDLSGKGRDVFGNFGASFFPVWTNNANILNGHSWAWFPSGGALLSRQMPVPISEAFSVWVVGKADTIAGNSFLSWTNAGSATANAVTDNSMGNGGANAPYTLNPGQWYIIETVWSPGAVNNYFKTNGVFGGTGNLGNISLGTLTVGAAIDNSGKLQGGIAFAAGYAGLPSTNFEAQMFTALNNYYGVYTSGPTNIPKGMVASGTALFVAGKATVTPSPLWTCNNTNAFFAQINGTNRANFCYISNVIDNTSFDVGASDAGATNRFYWGISKP